MEILFLSKSNLDQMLRETEKLSFWQDDSKAMMAVKPCDFPPEIVKGCPTIMEAIQELSSRLGKLPKYVMVNKLPPNVFVGEHTDTVPGWPFRYHLPLATNNGSFWWDLDNGLWYFPEGHWTGPVPYHTPHRVGNVGRTERVHLVVDLMR